MNDLFFEHVNRNNSEGEFIFVTFSAFSQLNANFFGKDFFC